MSYKILLFLTTGSCESQKLTTISLFKDYKSKPKSNEIVIDVKNLILEIIKYQQEEYNSKYSIYDLFNLELHELDLELNDILYNHRYLLYASNFCENNLKIEEIVYIGCLERILEWKNEDFFTSNNGNWVFDSGDFDRVKLG